jgi:hypothetical protein
VNGRLKLTHGFLQHWALGRAVGDLHQVPSCGYWVWLLGEWMGTLPIELVVMPQLPQ